MRVLVTGTAGFIGCDVTISLLAHGHEVVGIDNLNNYYDPSLKRDRLARLTHNQSFMQLEFCLSDPDAINSAFAAFRPERVVHLAAQAGVRYSLKNPQAYLQSNLVAFGNVLEACRQYQVEHLVYASSSSVYGNTTQQPFIESMPVDHPVSLYAATKKANELMAHSYSHLYGLPTTGLRFFTVYGPWGRPDMSPMIFCRKILAGEHIEVFNYGNHFRDFTYIDDIVAGISRVLEVIPGRQPQIQAENTLSSSAPYRIYNIGCQRPVHLLRFIQLIEANLGKEAMKTFLPMQPGDVEATFADVSMLVAATGYRPSTPVEEGVARFVDWYKYYYSARNK